MSHGGGDSEDISYRNRYSSTPPPPTLPSPHPYTWTPFTHVHGGSSPQSFSQGTLVSTCVSTERPRRDEWRNRSRGEKDPALILTAPTLSLPPQSLQPTLPPPHAAGGCSSWESADRSRCSPDPWGASQKHRLSGRCRSPTCKRHHTVAKTWLDFPSPALTPDPPKAL